LLKEGLAAALMLAASTMTSVPVEFGINGHPLVPGTYAEPLDRQIAQIRGLGLRTYRVNVNPDRPDTFDKLSDLVTLAGQQNIRILPVVVLAPKHFVDEDTAYARARSGIAPLVKRFGDRLTVWELGNEYDLYALKPGATGASPDDYDDQKYRVVRGLIRGMLDGVHEVNPTLRTIVETTQHTPSELDSGFLQRLIQDRVTGFDITGYHYYSKDGRVPVTADGTSTLAVLHDDFHRPIWITEFDESATRQRTVGPSADPTRQGEALTTAMTEISTAASKYDVVGADIYELLDEPALLEKPGEPAAEAQFGILNAQGEMTAASIAVQGFMATYRL
jgi:hypothetical protein